MARKHLLSDLAHQELPAGNSPQAAHPQAGASAAKAGVPGIARGAVGAVTRSLEQLRSQAVVELKADLIDPSPIADRLSGATEAHVELVASIKAHGQQVPILVRPHPDAQGRYQIAYGRRRLRAAKELDLPVRCLVRTLNDEELVVAQGMENTARADLSFIERAVFAANLEEGGFGRNTIMAALSVDKTGLSRLISSASRVSRELITVIGPAPKAGRDRWLELASRLDGEGATRRVQAITGSDTFASMDSDERFSAIFSVLAPKRRAVRKPVVITAEDGRRIATLDDQPSKVTLTVDKKVEAAFASFLTNELPTIYAGFLSSRRGVDDGRS